MSAFKILWKSVRLEGKELSTIEGVTLVMISFLFCCTSVIGSSRNHSIDPIYLEDRVLFAYLVSISCVQVALGTCTQLPAMGGRWVAAILY